MRLRRVDVSAPGWGRRRYGRGFAYVDENGGRITAPDQVERCRRLVIPPAWRDVWICPVENGHIQAVGTDDAGRRQYLYHPQWREQRDAAKHERVLEVARRLPAARRQVARDLALPGMPKDRVLAIAFRLLDVGLFRVGGESYAEENGSYGLATLAKAHVRITREGTAVFDYIAKSGQRRHLVVTDPELVPLLSTLRRRRGGGQELLAYREPGRHGRWVDVTSTDINAYVKRVLGEDATAKDFRTWHGTVLAALALAAAPPPETERERERVVASAVKEVAQHLGNTPTVARSAYIDPAVLEAFAEEETIDPPPSPGTLEDGEIPRITRRVESEVLSLLSDGA